MKPHPASSMQHTDADSSTAEHEAVSPGFHKRFGGGGQSQDQDGDLSVGIPITSSTGRFQLLHVITWELSLGFHLHRREEADWYKPLI